MTAFEKSLRALDGEALRAGEEELLSLLAEAGGTRRGRRASGEDGGRKQRGAAARVSAPDTADASPDRRGGTGTEIVPAVNALASNEERREAVRVRRDYPETDSDGPAAEEAALEGDRALPVSDFPAGELDEEDREGRKSRENQKARIERETRGDRQSGDDPEDWEGRENPEDPVNGEARKDSEEQLQTPRAGNREDLQMQLQTLHAEDWEPASRAETQALERRLESISARRRGSLRQSGEDGESGTYTAAFRGPERQYEGAVGARGMEMRRISEYFRRDSRRYDTGFTRY